MIIINPYSKVREVLLTNEEFKFYIHQPDVIGEDSKNLIIENPKVQPFSFKETGITGKLDEKRTRFSFDCAFRDISKNAEGRVSSLIIFNDKNEAFFESFTVFLTAPIEKTIRI